MFIDLISIDTSYVGMQTSSLSVIEIISIHIISSSSKMWLYVHVQKTAHLQMYMKFRMSAWGRGSESRNEARGNECQNVGRGESRPGLRWTLGEAG